MLKSTVMMIGEFDYGDIFLGDSSSYEGRSFYQVPAIIMFILFVISMTIIIMNLLVSSPGRVCQAEFSGLLSRLWSSHHSGMRISSAPVLVIPFIPYPPYAGISLGMHPANDRRRYIVTTSLIG